MTRTIVLTNHNGGMDKSISVTKIAFGLVQLLRSVTVANPLALRVNTDSQAHATVFITGSKDYGREHRL